ncbi:NAD(P)-dependent oxidoreductase [Candidatus Solincola tengchongensis]|uniref:NAD(P)-dependent oxidoreductase n=1 Tax=Candidatus Solincola tengchongensis TaxID=2900693 RepID=UPI00257E1854|nr:NAD(P)-dependent oxidoreductase [Candidatus Solincola tengchongensis]
MGREFLVALDAGGGSGRCLFLEVNSGEVFTARREWSHPPAPDTMGLGYDLDLEDIWNKLGECCREALKRSGAAWGEIAAIAATSMRNTTVLLDGEGKTLLATPNQDARALAESMSLAGERGKEIHSLSGHWPSPLFTASRLLWLRNRYPEALDKAAATLSLSDWLAWKMGGEPAAELSQAGETLLLDLTASRWASDLIGSLELPERIFPTVVKSGTRLGSLSPEAASHLGLPAGIPVVAGGADTQCGLLGAGAVSPGDLAVIAGTTMPLQAVTPEAVLDPEGRLWSGAHVIPGLFVLESNGLTAGYVLEWYAGLMYCEHSYPLPALLAEARLSRPGGSGVFSTLGTALFDARTISIPVGNLSLSHMVTPSRREGRRHVSRAVLEGIAYSARANLEQIEEVLGEKAQNIFVAGGLSRSSLWAGILSDVLGRPLTVAATPEVSALGAAICAGVGAGLLEDHVQGARRLGLPVRKHVPGPDREEYQALYAGWREACSLRSACDAHLSGLMTVSLLKGAEAEGERKSALFRPRALLTAVLDGEALDALSRDLEVDYRPWRREMRVYAGGEDLAGALTGCHILVTEMDVVDFQAMDLATDLRAIVVCRGNPVNVDLESATAFGIPVVRIPGRNADAVADLTVAFMIMLARKLQEASRFLREGNIEAGDLSRMAEAYTRFEGKELWRKTVGIIGLGEVGRRVAIRLRPFGARTLFFDPAVGEEEGALYHAKKVSLEELLAESDFVTLHAPKSEGTRGMMNREAFAAMKEGAFFINTSRASLVDHDALLEVLQSGHLAGAALDVFPQEPPASDHPLLLLDKVIATPHIGGDTEEVSVHQGALVVDQLGKLLRGEKPDHILNPEVMESFSWEGPRREPSALDRERLAKKEKPSITS